MIDRLASLSPTLPSRRNLPRLAAAKARTSDRGDGEIDLPSPGGEGGEAADNPFYCRVSCHRMERLAGTWESFSSGIESIALIFKSRRWSRSFSAAI